jgi:hypothetical protein
MNAQYFSAFSVGRWTLDVGRFPTVFRRGGRAVDRAGLENRKAERPREFESHPLRHLSFDFRLPIRRADNIGQNMDADVHRLRSDQNRDWKIRKPDAAS